MAGRGGLLFRRGGWPGGLLFRRGGWPGGCPCWIMGGMSMDYVACPEGHVVLASQVRTTSEGLKICPVCHGAQAPPGAAAGFNPSRPAAEPAERTDPGREPAPFSAGRFSYPPYSAATAPPLHPAAPPVRTESTTRPILLGAVIAGVAILIAAAVLAFIPLPRQTNVQGLVAGSTVSGTCGPGTSSSSAVEVKMNPQIVNQGASTNDAAGNRAWANYCQTVANRRITLSGALGAVGALLTVSCGLAYRRLSDRTPNTTAAPHPLGS